MFICLLGRRFIRPFDSQIYFSNTDCFNSLLFFLSIPGMTQYITFVSYRNLEALMQPSADEK